MSAKPTWVLIIRDTDGYVRTLALQSVPVVRREAARYRGYGLAVAVVDADAALDGGVDEFAEFDRRRREARSVPVEALARIAAVVERAASRVEDGPSGTSLEIALDALTEADRALLGLDAG